MDEEPVAKRRCLNFQSQPPEGFFQIHHTSTLPGLDNLFHIQEEVAHNGIQSIASTADEIDINRAHGANESRHDMKADSEGPNSEVCFGMFTIPDIAILNPQILSPNAEIVCVEVASGRLTILAEDEHDKQIVGSIRDESHVEILQRLQKQSCLRLQMYCQVKSGSSVRTQARVNVRAQCELSVILYGRGQDSNKVGDYLQACGFYLQDPEHCDCDVLYANPHCLSSLEGGILLTSSMQMPASTEENMHDPRDIFDSLSGVTDLEETETPTIMKTPLKSHQKQALTFFLQRERGWAFDASNNDVWTKSRGSSAGYCNNVTGKCQGNAPPQFRGGILADQMGLGKTVEMIALVASDADKILPTGCIAWKGAKLAGTLIVVPFSLLETWTDQLTEFVSTLPIADSPTDFQSHVQFLALTWHIYHGRRRERDLAVLAGFNIVITTYETVVSDKKNASQPMAQQTTLFDITWQRIIVDEAHFIGRISTLRAQAVCSLNAYCRWAVTGTPVQNRLTDLGTLLYFLRVHPFDDTGVFDKEFLRPWKKQSDPSVLDRLRALVRFITLRRSKEVLHLMPRKDHLRRLQFSPSERELHDNIRTRTRDAFPELLNPQAATKANHFNTLAWIDRLRKICNHGLIVERLPLAPIQSVSPRFHGLGNHDNELLGSGSETVGVEESSDIDLLNHVSQSGIGSPVSIPSGVFATPTSQDLLQVDSDRGNSESDSPRVSGCASPDPFAITTACMAMPTKIQRLICDLTDNEGDQKSIVFSFWTSTLDLIPPALEAVGLGYARHDGRQSKSQRSRSLQDFRTNPDLKVLLATLSTAGFGVDLTVATRVFLLEPQWNPMAEEQALSRIHRMGQTKPVVTVRYIMQDSIEENIYELQRRKLKLAALTISDDVKPEDYSYLEDLRFLLS